MDDHTVAGMAAKNRSGQTGFGVDDGVAGKIGGDGGRTESGTSGASLHHLTLVGPRGLGPIKEGGV